MKYVSKGLIFSLLLVFSTQIFGGVRITIKETDYSPYSEPRTTTTVFQIDDGKLRMDLEEDGKTISYIYLQQQNIVHLIDHSRKAYATITEEDIQRMAGQMKTAMNQAMQMMQEKLKDLPADQREMIEKMMKEQMPPPTPPAEPKVEFKKVGTGEKVGQWTCDRWEIYKDGVKAEVIWVSASNQLPEGTQIIQLFQKFTEFWTTGFKKLLGDEMGMEWFSTKFQEKINGFPVAGVTYENGQETSRWELVSAESRTSEKSAFLPPAEYQRIALEALWQMDESP
ncbi:MAG: hypothetical protein GXO78_06470 [Calditrichaeota bacterium]|nr:hypothetical protein [Calditrichota bacterium]